MLNQAAYMFLYSPQFLQRQDNTRCVTAWINLVYITPLHILPTNFPKYLESIHTFPVIYQSIKRLVLARR